MLQGVECRVRASAGSKWSVRWYVSGCSRAIRCACGGHAFGVRVQGAGCRVQGAGCRVQGPGFRVQGSGFRVQGPGSKVQGPGSVPAAVVAGECRLSRRAPPPQTLPANPPARMRIPLSNSETAFVVWGSGITVKGVRGYRIRGLWVNHSGTFSQPGPPQESRCAAQPLQTRALRRSRPRGRLTFARWPRL